jgi:hypothetical protein
LTLKHTPYQQYHTTVDGSINTSTQSDWDYLAAANAAQTESANQHPSPNEAETRAGNKWSVSVLLPMIAQAAASTAAAAANTPLSHVPFLGTDSEPPMLPS